MDQQPEKITDIIARLKNKAEQVRGSGSSHSPESTPANRLSRFEQLRHQVKRWGIADDCIAMAPTWKEKASELSAHMEKNQVGIFMFGQQGRRKTTCATAILLHELNRFFERKSPYRSVQFIFVPDLLNELYGCFRRDSDVQAGDIIYRYAEYDFLVMDGMGEGQIVKGNGQQSEFAVSSLGTLIHHRDANRLTRRTVITSNYTLQELGDRLDSRISSRIANMCEDFEFTGEDYRLKK